MLFYNAAGMNPEIETLQKQLVGLKRAVSTGRSLKWCLTLWSRFIRARDGYRCVECGSEDRVSAHHIFRKVMLPAAQLQTGNGITLCKQCHSVIHEFWNGRPRPQEPLNSRSGDNQDIIASLYHALERNARERAILRDDFYYLSDEVLALFKRYQGFEDSIELCGPRVSQAHRLWQNPPVNHYTHLAELVIPALMIMDAKESVNFLCKSLSRRIIH